MNIRVETIEHELAAVKIDVASIRSNYATREDVQSVKAEVSALGRRLDSELHSLEFKTYLQRLDSVLAGLATKADLQHFEGEVLALKQRLDSELPNLASKADLQEVKNETRAWIVGMGITLLVALGGLQFSFYTMLRTSLTAQSAAATTGAVTVPQAAPASKEIAGVP